VIQSNVCSSIEAIKKIINNTLNHSWVAKSKQHLFRKIVSFKQTTGRPQTG